MESVPEGVCSFAQSLKVRLHVNQRVTECMSNFQEPWVPDECPKLTSFVTTVSVIFIFPSDFLNSRVSFIPRLSARDTNSVSMCFH